MKKHIGKIVSQMSPGVRQQAEAEALAKGMTLEDFVSSQLSAQLTETDLSSVVGGAIRLDNIRYDRTYDRLTDGDTRIVTVGIRF